MLQQRLPHYAIRNDTDSEVIAGAPKSPKLFSERSNARTARGALFQIFKLVAGNANERLKLGAEIANELCLNARSEQCACCHQHSVS